MPAHIDGAVAPAVPWATKVNQRKAPGAMSAIAFIVKPVRPRVGFIVGSALSAIVSLLFMFVELELLAGYPWIKRYFLGAKYAISPRRAVGCDVAPFGWPFFSKKGLSDQSVRNSARVINQSVSLYSPVRVNSLTEIGRASCRGRGEIS